MDGGGEENNATSFSIEDILAAWDLSQYTDKFVENEFVATDIFTLSDDANNSTLKDLIPIGSHRLKFKANCRALLAAEELGTVECETGSEQEPPQTGSTTMTPHRQASLSSFETISSSVLRDSNSNSSSSTGLQLLSKRKATELPRSTPFAKRCQVGADEFINDSQEDGSSSTLPGDTSSSAPSRKATSSAPPRETSSNATPRGTSSNATPRETSSSAVRSDALSSAPDQELCDLLKETGSGRIILALARKGKVLKYDKDQNRLCELIIEKKILSSPNFKIPTTEWPDIVKSIKTLFPHEDENIYYIPYSKHGERKCGAKGKLVSKYYSLRKELRASGVIQGDGDHPDDDDDNDDNDGDDLSHVVEDANEKIQFLQENTSPWTEIVTYWNETSRLRLSSIQKLLKAKPKKTKKNHDKENDGDDEIDSTVTSYIASYPALRTREGYTLFEADFAKLYPAFALKIYSDFDEFIEKAAKALRRVEKKPPALENNLEILEDDNLSKEAKQLVVLLSLGYLDSVVTVARRKRQGKIITWRPPQSEIQEGLVAHVETPGRVNSFISARYEKFASWGLAVQPFVVACGRTIDEIEDCYVVLSKDVKYNGINSVRRALDICFKIIHAVNAEYSCECYRLWMLIQKRLYGLDTKADGAKNDAQLPNVLKRFDC